MAPLGTVQKLNVGMLSPKYRLPAAAHVGKVRLAVSNLARSIQFYTQTIGLTVFDQTSDKARLGVAGSTLVLLELEQLPGVNPIASRTRLGLYHTAFLLPNRAALSSFVAHLIKQGTYFGSGDHLYSEAMYLVDPDGLSVEVYADRSRDEWVYDGAEIVSATNPVKFTELLAIPKPEWQGAPAGTVVGHVHLYIGDLEQGADFYHAALGLDIVTWRYPGALFLSAGGYHHDVAINVWAAGSPPAAASDARLLFWELVFPSEEDRAAAAKSLSASGYQSAPDDHQGPIFLDPWGTRVLLTVAQA